mmetsp:Transcript_119278/g.342718  ORF Transcript_119278/g.342718 Transcript_119278/m.342718 type:complete len:367 (+) Transcript_119278:529-1629(+)
MAPDWTSGRNRTVGVKEDIRGLHVARDTSPCTGSTTFLAPALAWRTMLVAPVAGAWMAVGTTLTKRPPKGLEERGHEGEREASPGLTRWTARMGNGDTMRPKVSTCTIGLPEPPPNKVLPSPWEPCCGCICCKAKAGEANAFAPKEGVWTAVDMPHACCGWWRGDDMAREPVGLPWDSTEEGDTVLASASWKLPNGLWAGDSRKPSSRISFKNCVVILVSPRGLWESSGRPCSNQGSRCTCAAVARCAIVLCSVDRNNLSMPSMCGSKCHGGSRSRVAFQMSRMPWQPSTKMPPGVCTVRAPCGGLLSQTTCIKVTPMENTSPRGNHLRDSIVSGGMYPGVPPQPVCFPAIAWERPKSMRTMSGLA